jgi:acetolactate synthase-1/2/3 large subunit
MRPERILAEVREVLPRDAIITTDVGWNKNGVGQQFPIYTPGSILTPGGFATMGFGAPAAIGAKLACPSGWWSPGRRRRLRPEPGPAGDGLRGGRRGHLGDHEQRRLRHHRRPAEGPLRHHRRHGVQKRDGEPYSPDYAALARAYGVDGVRWINAATSSSRRWKRPSPRAVRMCST